MRITLYGAGAIGCYLAVHFATVPDVQLSLVARGETLAAIRRDGVRLLTPDGERVARVHATDDPASLGEQDVVFVTLKAHQMDAALPGIASLLGAQSVVVPPTTGMPFWYFHGRGETQLPLLDPAGRQWALLRPERALGCAYWVGADSLGPGVVKSAGAAGFPIGEPSGEMTPRLAALQGAMTAAGLRAPVRADIRAEIWAKMINSLVWNPLAVLTRASLGEIATAPEVVALARRMMTEAEAVAGALGTVLATPLEKRIAGTLAARGHRMSML